MVMKSHRSAVCNRIHTAISLSGESCIIADVRWVSFLDGVQPGNNPCNYLSRLSSQADLTRLKTPNLPQWTFPAPESARRRSNHMMIHIMIVQVVAGKLRQARHDEDGGWATPFISSNQQLWRVKRALSHASGRLGSWSMVSIVLVEGPFSCSRILSAHSWS